MAKTPTPLLSLEAHGTIGEAITYQGKGALKIARKKPELPYFLTLPAQYQRWLYQDYVYQWNNLTPAQKQTYQSAGVPYHLTGFQYFMKSTLTNLPDLAAYWKLDDNLGATARDSSRNNLDCTIIGASPADGLIDGCLSFDGVNDRLITAISTLYQIDTFTLMLFFNWPGKGVAGLEQLAGAIWPGAGGSGYQLYVRDQGGGNFFITARLRTNGFDRTRNFPVTQGVWHHTALTYDGVQLYLILDNVYSAPRASNLLPSNQPFTIGAQNGTWPYIGLIDHVTLFNRVLDSTEIQAHSERRWPS